MPTFTTATFVIETHHFVMHVQMFLITVKVTVLQWKPFKFVNIDYVKCYELHVHQHTRSCISSQKDVWHTSVLFTGTANSPFSTPHISITAGPISI